MVYQEGIYARSQVHTRAIIMTLTWYLLRLLKYLHVLIVKTYVKCSTFMFFTFSKNIKKIGSSKNR